MGAHSKTAEGMSDDWFGCCGEDREDPSSWDDPDIQEAWDFPPHIEPEED